jgi:protein TonB
MPSIAHSINSTDRLGMMLLIALVIHAVLILGVVFDTYAPKKENSEKALDIIVVRQAIPEKNDKKADFLAEKSQKGGGELEEKKKLTSLPSKPTIQPQPVKRVEQLPVEKSPPPEPAKKIIVSKKPVNKKLATQTKPKIEEKTPKKISMDQLLRSTQAEIDMLSAEIDLRNQTHSRKPRRKHINSSTQEYKYASYLTAWRRKVENIGNLNYPDEAKRKKIYGNILMTVVLKPNGRVKSIKIRKSSGHKILDDAAVRIVNLASPFAPFPENIRQETDELVITRTWQFVSGNTLFRSK